MPTTGTRLSVLSTELPRAITPAVAGLTVGAFVGVVGFVAVLLLVGRGNRRGPRRPPMPADRIVFIPPYGTLQRDTPLPPAAFQVPPQAQHGFAQPHFHRNAQPHGQYGQHGGPYGPYGQPPPADFRPSTDLSARAFARMGAVESEAELDSPTSAPELSIDCEMFEDDDVVAPFRAVAVSAILVVEESGPVRAADKSAPHRLAIIPTGSSAMVANPPSAPASTPPGAPSSSVAAVGPASFADLEMDEGATEIGEPYFDEPPQPRRRTDPPKIRAVAPTAPRFPVAAKHVPVPTPPTPRAVPSARSCAGDG